VRCARSEHLKDAVALFPADDDHVRSEPSSGRAERRGTSIGWLLITAALAGTVVLGLLPAPYVIEGPGPVYDTLGDVTLKDGTKQPVIQISGAPTYPTDGELNLLTVLVSGTREAPPSWIEVATAWFQSSRAVVPIDAVYPDGQTDEEADQESAAEMANSQQEAVAAAFEELDIAYQVVVNGVIEGTPADGVLEVGDQLVSANGTPIEGITDLRTAISENGTDRAMALTVVRGGVELVLSLTPVPASANDSTPIIGIQGGYIFPFDVTIQLENVGGPSAGTMFALGVYDKLTEGELTGGEVFAGTGTIRADGAVGPIGGIRQKMYGAVDAGATVFLAPMSNCDEVTGHSPAGLHVYAITTLDDAIDVVQTVGAQGSTSELATSPA
jgi:PDZ domain-containing protein